jgi:1,4-dihydroxy-2-naphthoyl-CoA hydrolase
MASIASGAMARPNTLTGPFTLDDVRDSIAGTFPGEVGIEPLELTPEAVRGRLVVEERHLHPGRLVHGGVWVTLADSVAAWGTMLHLAPGQYHSTIELKTNLIASGRLGDELTAVARPVHVGNRTQVWSVDIDNGRRHAAAFTCTQMVITPDDGPSG